MEELLKTLEELKNEYAQLKTGYAQLKTGYEQLKTGYSQLEAELTQSNEEKTRMSALLEYYKEQFNLAQHNRFAQSSEKSKTDERQGCLFDEAENEADLKKPEPDVEEITYTRRRHTGSRKDDISALPVEEVVHTLPEEERVCPECGGHMHVMGHTPPRDEIEIIPARAKIVRHVAEVYACRSCEHNNTEVPIKKAPMPEPVIKGGLASAGSVAHIMVQKYANALPLYRQEQSLKDIGLTLSRQTMANWLIKASTKWLDPLYGLMHSSLLSEDILHADETVVQVLKENIHASRKQSYMWLYRTGRYTDKPAVLYEYQPTRSSTHPKNFLAGFTGCLHTDGYGGYKTAADASGQKITLCGCWAHLRRRFHEAVITVPPAQQKNCLSYTGLEYCNRLFALEHSYKDLKPEERYQRRLKESKPVSDAFFDWVRSVNAVPKSLLGKALYYANEQRPYLEAMYRDGRLEMTNNRAERSIKPFVIGRKNWMFSCTPRGAKASATIYSIIETAKENGLVPFEYLKYIFTAMPAMEPENYSTLLPWSKTLPEYCRRAITAEDTQQTACPDTQEESSDTPPAK